MDAAGLELIGETPAPGLMPARPEESPGRWGLFGLGGLTGLGCVGLLGGCAGLLPGIFGLLGWVWAERNERATVQAATTPKHIAAVRAFFIFAPLFWFLKSCSI
jgi:hypothetical protein